MEGNIKMLLVSVRLVDATLITEPAFVGNDAYLIIGQTIKVEFNNEFYLCNVFEQLHLRRNTVVKDFPNNIPTEPNRTAEFDGLVNIVGATVFTIDDYPKIEGIDDSRRSLTAIPLSSVIAMPVQKKQAI